MVPADGGGQQPPLEGLEEFEPRTPPLHGDDGRVRLSFSRIDLYRRCPAQFRYRYVDRMPGVPAPPLSFGTSIHAALERFYDRKLPSAPSLDDLLGYLYERWDTTGFRRVDRPTQIEYYRLAQDVLRRFHAREAPRYRLPVAVEAWFEVPVGDDALLVGSIDRVDVDEDGGLRVVDYKTNRRVHDRAAVARSLQLSLYALACDHLYGRLPTHVALDFVVPGVRVEVAIEDLDLDDAREQVARTAAAIRAERYAPTPSRRCDWCDFKALCPAWADDDPDALGPAVVEADRLRRSIRRDLRALRELEAGIERSRAELERPAPRTDGDP